MDPVKIKSFDLYHYALPLTQPLYVRRKNVNKREGIIISIQSQEGEEGFGEIAPLPGLSQENLTEACDQIKGIKEILIGQDIPGNLKSLNGGFEKWFKEFHLKPSVQFGVETAILNLLANSKNISLAQLIDDPFHDYVFVHGLLHGSINEAQQQALDLIRKGFTSLKLKVGKDVEEEISKIQAIGRMIEGKAVLHLDANQSWDVKQAIYLGETIGLSTVDYIEEPFKNTEDIPEFFMKTTIPVALDESLQSIKIEQIKSIEGAELLILKPTVLGGVEKTVQWIRRAKQYGISAVLSSAYESSIGILVLANLAAISSRCQSAGLDTLKWFREDVLTKQILIEHGKIKFAERRIHTDDVNFNVLKKID